MSSSIQQQQNSKKTTMIKASLFCAMSLLLLTPDAITSTSALSIRQQPHAIKEVISPPATTAPIITTDVIETDGAVIEQKQKQEQHKHGRYGLGHRFPRFKKHEKNNSNRLSSFNLIYPQRNYRSS